MAVTPHVFPSFTQNMAAKALQLASTPDTIKVALYNGSTPTWPGTLGVATVVTLANWVTVTGFTEITGTGYSAGGATATSVATTTSGLVTTLTCANVTWSSATFTAAQAVFYDSSVSNDLICYWDFGGSQSVSGATFTLTISGSGLVTWTAS
jgi:hypothetical protein